MFKPMPTRIVAALCGALAVLGLSAGSASASGPPIVSVTKATNLTLNTAELNGTWNNNGGGTGDYTFEYGKTALYGKSIRGQAPGGNANVRLAGLEPLTAYHFRIKAWNELGTTYSSDMTFEMLLDWKVDGKPASELEGSALLVPDWFQEEKEEVATLELPAPFGGKDELVTVSCEAAEEGHIVVLDEEYNLPFHNCKTYYESNEYPEGIEVEGCEATDMVLHLDAFGASPAGFQKLELGEGCPIGESITLAGGSNYGQYGLEIKPFEEAKSPELLLPSKLPGGWVLHYGPKPFFLAGPLIGHTFGVS